MTLRQSIFLGWFFGVPLLLLGLWVGQVGPAAGWDWAEVTSPWWVGVPFVIIIGQLGAFDEETI